MPTEVERTDTFETWRQKSNTVAADGVAVGMPMLPMASLRWRGNGDDVAADGDGVAIAMTMPMLPMAR